MLRVVKYKDGLGEVLRRPSENPDEKRRAVAEILSEVRVDGDRALRKFSREFDRIELDGIQLDAKEFRRAGKQLDQGLKRAIRTAAANITRFHKPQLRKEKKIRIARGVICWRKPVPIRKVGLYIPGGSAPLFSTVLMLGIPAKLAGCGEIILCTPAGRNGMVHPAILYAAEICGIKKVFTVGGAQAIAAMAYGTETIPAVHKIFGPGNSYVTLAKQLVQNDGVAIDMPAGPSELAILADKSGSAAFIASDLLSQAEHGPDSQVVLVTDSQNLIGQVQEELSEQLAKLPRKAMAEKALGNSAVVLVRSMKEGLGVINEYAPEHLILACKNAENLAGKIVNAGSVFIGSYSCESLGDYASGPNHTLPTNGYAKAYSGVSVDSFVKMITFQKVNKKGIDTLGNAVIRMALEEGLEAHANAVRIRLTS